jgi:hypothetical protein
MTDYHLSDTDIQEYLLHREKCRKEVFDHMEACELCMTKAANYSLIFEAMALVPAPAADMDLAGSILARLPAGRRRKRRDGVLVYLLAMAGLVIVVPGYLFRRSFLQVLENVPALLLYLVVAASLVILLFRARAVVKHYQRRMKMLEFS